MIRIAFLVDKIGGTEGGTETQLLMLLGGLDQTRFKPHLIHLRPSEFLSRKTFPYPVTHIPFGKFMSKELPKGLLAFRRLDRRERFDIVQTVFWDSTVFGSLAAKLSGCPAVISSRRSLGYWRTRNRSALLKVLRHGIDHYITNSDPVKEEIVSLDGVDSERVSVIPNGIDLAAFDEDGGRRRQEQRQEWGFGKDHLVIGGIGTLRPVKQVETLVEAAIVLLQEFAHIRFVWIGSGAVDKYRQLARSRGLEDRFIFPGPTREVPKVLSGLDIAVQCSASESLSNSLLEYMAKGLPIVASNVGGTNRAIIDGRSGLLYQPGEANALENALRRVIQDPALREALGASAQDLARSRYSREAMIRSHEELYARIHELKRSAEKLNGVGR